MSAVELHGFIAVTPEGNVRVHRVDNPTTYVEVDQADVASYRRGDGEDVGVAVLKDSADGVEGHLDEESFASLFTLGGIPKDDSPFRRETAFKYCYSWNPPGGGGYC